MVDDGTLPDRRGSLTVDDEGTPTNCTVLIEDGILKGYMQDRMNARLLGAAPTGNGRRQSFAHAPMPRMTNTYMLAGDRDPQEIIASVKRGLYAVNFGGGQVDITSGKFVFSASEAYLIEDGKVGPAVKGATLIGNGPDALTKVTMIGNDLRSRSRDRDLRQGWAERAGRRRPADLAHGRTDRRRHQRVRPARRGRPGGGPARSMRFRGHGRAAALAVLVAALPAAPVSACTDLADASSTHWSLAREHGVSWLVTPCGQRFFSLGVNALDGGYPVPRQGRQDLVQLDRVRADPRPMGRRDSSAAGGLGVQQRRRLVPAAASASSADDHRPRTRTPGAVSLV